MKHHLTPLELALFPTAALLLTIIPLGAGSPAAAQSNWPDAISIPTGFEPEGIELGRGHEFFVGAFSLSSFFGATFGVHHEPSAFAGAIYKGNLRTGEGAILVPPTGKPVSGEASPLQIEGAEQLFPNGDGLYLSGRTLYILQNFDNKIAVVQLSGDLTGGEFVRNIPGEGETNPLDIATTLIGFGNSLYAINTHFFDLIFGDPALVQSEVVRLRK